jgi:hypothetical protein
MIAAVAALFSTDAHAQSPPLRVALDDFAACLAQAERRTELVPDQRERLCIASPSPSAPVDCYVEATRTLLLADQEAVELCRCTPTIQPVRCVEALRREARMTDPEMIAFCSPTSTRGLRADCTPIP